MVLVPAAPWITVRLLGDAERAKFGGGTRFTVSETRVVLIKLPEVPVIVMLAVPVVALELAVSVRVLALVVLLGLNEAVTPVGRPAAARLTLPLKPFCGVTVMVLEAAAPCVTVKTPGDADRTKLGKVEEPGQLPTRLAAFTVPIPVAKSQPVVVP